MLDLLLALLAGVATIAAPCTLPVLPILLGAALGDSDRLRPAFIAVGFVATFAAVALLLSALTRLLDFDPNLLRSAAAILLLGFGVLMIWPKPFEAAWSRLGGNALLPRAGTTSRRGMIGGLLLGATLGLIWTPCAGPVLGSILTLVASAKDTAWASMLLVTYAVGAALPMLAIGYGGRRAVARVRSVARIAPRLQQGFGVIVVAFALASYFQYDTEVVAWLTSFYPAGQIGL
ncbi:cytochrome c biogenesis CcdA family protein [Rhodopseudomonas sp. B29]|uniref:cytochrome c biogenesis CcdA family protein n=1 Tax=Rhodopseudomonas sp. B29 TaxID=95607 RepID=UPI00034B77C4|nr:cytochrome c biogenesis protein CcdA [Rhodopseudomonas sp. B29]